MALNETFSSTLTTYTAAAANAVTSITVEPAPGNASAEVAYLNASDVELTDADTNKTGFQADLTVGDNVIKVQVTAEDDNTTLTYTVTVTRAAAAAGVTVSTTALTVTEQDTTGDSYTVVLDTEPTANVTVTVAGHAGTDVTPDPATLTFTASNWETAQTVTVTAGDDADTTDDSVTLTHSAASTDNDYSGIAIDEVAVTVNDNDTAQVTGVSVTSGNAQLAVNWTAVDNATGYKVQWKSGGQGYNTGNRQFTVPSGTTTSHTITGLANGTEYTVRVSATRTGANDGPPSSGETGTPAVPTAAGVTVSTTALTVTEQDTTGGSYTVVLDTQPTATVTVTVAGHAGTDVTPDPATLTFTSTTWSTAQTVAVTAGDDADTTDDSVTLTHSAASADNDYSGIAIDEVAVTVNDNDTAQVTGVSVTSGNAQLAVNWTAVDNATGYKVQWKSGGQGYNTGNRQFTVPSGTTTSHTITGLANGTEYTVQVSATRTDANDGPPSAEGQGTPNTTNNPPVFTGGETQARTLAETVGDATVAAAANIGAAVAATDTDVGDTLTYALEGTDADKFTFDTTTGQIKTKAGESYDYEAQSSYSLTVTVKDSTVTVSAAVTINVTDNTTEKPRAPDAPTVTATLGSMTSLNVSWTAPENTGRPRITSYDLQYTVQRTSNWTDGPQGVSGTNASISGLMAETSYDVQVRANNDDGEGAWSASGSGATRNPTPTDTDVLVSNTGEALAIGVTSSINAQSFVTGFNAGGYTISAVQIRLKSVSGKTTVVRIREDDNGKPGDLVATLTNPASLSSYEINTFTAPPGTTLAASTTYWITTSEGVFILSRLTSALTGATAEIGEPGWSIGDGRLYRSRDREPWFTETQSSLMIAIKGTAIGAASDDATLGALTVDDGTSDLTLDPAFAPGTLAYAAEVGNAVTTVTLTAMTTANDASVSAVTLNGTAIADVDFTDGITVSPLLVGDNEIDVTVTAENGDTRTYTLTVTRAAATTTDTPGVRVTPTALTVTEEDPTGDSYTVGLNTQPTAAVTVTVAGHAGTAVTPNPTTLTFTTSNWNTDQTVTVTAGNDADLVNDTVTLTHSAMSADSSYQGITIAGVTVTVTDNDNTAAGICGRTPAVRDELLRLIENNEGTAVACADVTATHLAAITRTLNLSGQNIADLKAGDFAGLTSLTDLYLFNNALTTLPDDVFDDLTALEILTLGRNDLPTLPAGVFDRLIALTELGLDNNDLPTLPAGVFDRLIALEILTLNGNDLPTLPAGVFDRLIALEILTLNGNDLPTLPAGVFDRLIALTVLQLQDNPGAPFAPTADARPDDGTVPVAGGAVMLDGSGGGGPWGTNVSYSWELTTPTSGVTFDDNRSAMPVVTIPALPEDTELSFTLTVTGRGGTDGIASDTDTAKVTATGSPASDDATLGALTVDDGTSNLTLDPAFAPGTLAYAAEVGNAVTTVTLTAMTTANDASVSAVTLNGTAIADVDFTDGITVSPLLVGDNEIVVTVTAENGDTRTYTLTVTRQAAVDNTAPTASDASVTTNEDTAHTFAAADVNFSDSDGDALASVTVVTLPAEGALALNGTAVTAGQVVPAADIAQLVFTPAANGNGTGYARFTFRVSDGTDLSASAYTMTVNVTAVNDPATGAPAISGTAQVGQTLTAATTDITDADGLASPSYGYQWVRVDGSNETDIAGATSGTYMPAAADVGKKLKVKVSFTDDDSNDEELTSDAYPASGTVEAAPNTAPTVTISADKTSAVFKEDDITYTVTRTGSTTAALPVTVRLTQTEDFLAATALTSKTVTIGAGQSTATFTVAASSFQHFAAGTKVGGGTLTATVQDGSAYDPGTTDSVEVDIAIGVMIGFEMAAYSVGEATGAVKVKVIAHTGPGAGQPTSGATYNILPADGSATNRSDFFFVNIAASFLVSNFSESGGVWQAEHGYNVTITNDEDDEDDETFDLRIERVQSTATYSLVDASGNSCGSVCTATVTIIDDDTATATPGVTVSKTALTVTEQDTTGDSYTVVLYSQPAADVVVTVAGHAGTDVTVTPGSLTFTSTTWSTAQTVTVTAGDDADTTDDSVSLTHGAASTDTVYNGIGIAGVVVTVSDNDAGEEPLPLVSVADVKVREDPGAVLAFQVTLDRASRETATVDWETLNGRGNAGAKAGQDYVAASGTLVFAPGETVKSVNVAVLDDAHDEGQEVMLLYLWNPVGAIIADAVAKGTIKNSDPLPRALMGRFGRTAAVHVVERVEQRMAAPREVGFEAQFAGRQVRPGMAREMALDFLRQIGASAGMHAPGSAGARSGAPMAATDGSMGRPAGIDGATVMAAGPMDGMAVPDDGLFDRGLPSMGLGGGNLLTGSSFAVNRKTRQGGLLSFWSRGAQASFAGRERTLGLDGDVRTTMIGADYATGPMVVGLSLAHSRGRGGYHGLSALSSGHVASSVTGLYPWLGYKLSDRVSVWGVTGYGKGALTLTPGEAEGLRSGLSMAMAAGGLRGELADSAVAGFGLAFKADALWVGTGIEGVEGPGGNLAATAAAVTRFRTGLEASRGYSFQRGLSLQPSLEVGLRRDGGDAETGAGVDIGGGLIVSDRLTGLSADVRVRMLVAHQDEGFRERGLSVSFSFDPTPSTPLGFLAKVTPSWGGQAISGAQALWGQETMAGMPQGGGASGGRLEAELGYGMPVGGRLVGMPRFGIGTSEYGRDYRLGYGLTVAEGGAMSFELGVDAHRRESLGQQGAEHGVQGRLTARW